MNTNPLGYHTIWDLYECNPETISYLDDVKLALSSLVNQLSFTPLKYVYNQFEPHGVTALVLLSESHISIHTWPEIGYVSIDIFSCKPFDHEMAEGIIKKHFDFNICDKTTLQRGLRQPKPAQMIK